MLRNRDGSERVNFPVALRTRSCLSEFPPTVREWEKICCTDINLTLAELMFRSATELIL